MAGVRHQVELREARAGHVPVIGLQRDVVLEQRARLGPAIAACLLLDGDTPPCTARGARATLRVNDAGRPAPATPEGGTRHAKRPRLAGDRARPHARAGPRLERAGRWRVAGPRQARGSGQAAAPRPAAPRAPARPRHRARGGVRGRPPDADRHPEGHQARVRVRLRAPGGLRPQLPARARHRRAVRGRGRGPHLHVLSPEGASLVGRRALHERGLRLLVEPRRERRRALARRTARDPPSRRRDAEGDLPRPDDGAVSLVQAQQPVPHRPGGRVPDHHLPPGALPEAVPQGLQHRGCAEEARARRGAPQLGGPPQQERRDVPDGQPRHAHAPALAPHRRAAGAGLRVRAESLLPPGGRAGPAASLHRPARHDAGGAGRHSGEDVDGRGRPPGAVYLLRPGPVPPEERAASRLPRLPLEHRGPLHRGHLPESDDERSGHAPDPPGPALPPGAVAGREPAGDQPHPLLRPRAARAEHGAPEPGRPRGAPERLRAVRPPAGQPAPRRDGPDERGTAAASGSARTGSGSISSWRRPARRRSTRTCWSS